MEMYQTVMGQEEVQKDVLDQDEGQKSVGLVVSEVVCLKENRKTQRH